MEGEPSKRKHWGLSAAQWVLLAVVTPVAVALLSAISIASWERLTTEPPQTRTEVRFFSPFVDGESEVRYVPRARCFVNLSIVDEGNPQAHRCGWTKPRGGLGDPCFSGPDMVCVPDPWSRERTVLRDVKWILKINRPPFSRPWSPERDGPLSGRRPSLQRAAPWAVQLDNGQRCVFASGTSDVAAGRRFNYFCDREGNAYLTGDGQVDGWLLGVPNRSDPVWIVPYREADSDETVERRVVVAWY